MFRWKSLRRSPTTSESSFSAIAFLSPSLAPNIVTLEVHWDNGNDPTYQLFLTDPHLCPNLESITLNVSSRPNVYEPVSQELCRAICSNANWRHVMLSPPIDDVVLRHLGMSSTLRTVSVTLAPQTLRLDEACFGSQDTPFGSVTDLALVLLDSLDFATSLLRDRDQVFRSFQLTLHTLTAETEVSALLTALSSPQRIHSLQAIAVGHPLAFGLGLSTSDSQPLSYETFRPLVSLAHLRVLVIDFNYPASLSDQEFANLVCNWPLLEVLQMTWTRGERSSASMTLQGLLLLLASCPKLCEIGMTLDARDVPVGDTYAGVCNPFITSPMHFHNCPLRDPDMLAEFLVKHLPSMPRVRWTHTLPNLEDQRLWVQVNQRMHPPVW